jgi:ATP-dependent DNA helicase RecQ
MLDPQILLDIIHWLNTRSSKIDTIRIKNVVEGIALLDGTLHSRLFVDFMKNRSTETNVNPELIKLILYWLEKLSYSFVAVIPVPSRTWRARKQIAQFIAQQLGAHLFLDFLQWRKIPPARQGELLNNDQRKHNVEKCMQVAGKTSVPHGAILLLDDYTGSGATIKEAARTLRDEAGLQHEIVPFTIAAIKWRLGKRGMV